MVKYYPAVQHSYIDGNVGVEFMWWRKECPIYHPFLLVSYGIVHPNSDNRWRKALKVPSDVDVIMDSGGFQTVRGLNITPEEVLSWQFNNANEGDKIAILDYPVTLKEDNNMDIVEKKAKKTAMNAQLWLKEREKRGINVKIYTALQGHNYDTIKMWWKYMKDYALQSDGVGVGGFVSANMPEKLVLKTSFLYNEGIKNMHIFGVSGKMLIPLLILEEMKMKINISLDSSTYSFMTDVKSTLLVPIIMKRIDIGRRGDKKGTNYNNMVCHCPVCQKFLGGNIGPYAKSKNLSPIVLGLHDLWSLIMYLDGLNWISNNIDKYIVENFKRGSEILDLMYRYMNGDFTPKDLRKWF
jgi:tRNA-guanine family transglycosylase